MNQGYQPVETLPVEQLRELQLERLQWTLAHTYDNVDHYRDAFDAAGIHPTDVIKTQIGITIEVVVGEPGSIPRSQGKAQRVIDER